MYFIQYTQRGIIKSDYHFVSETSFRKFMILSINKEFILPSCVITMDVALYNSDTHTQIHIHIYTHEIHIYCTSFGFVHFLLLFETRLYCQVKKPFPNALPVRACILSPHRVRTHNPN